MKIELQNGLCALRFGCKNVNKEYCDVLPDTKKDYVECSHYQIWKVNRKTKQWE